MELAYHMVTPWALSKALPCILCVLCNVGEIERERKPDDRETKNPEQTYNNGQWECWRI